MLSAVRAMASRVAHDLAHMDTRRLGPDATAEEQDELLAEVLENALEAGKEAVERGPEQLAVLREAGVVDAGAYGLTVIVAGCLAALRGDAAPRARAPVRARPRCTGPSTSRRASATARTSRSPARASTPAASPPLLEDLGDSVLVVGDDRTLRVHVHTDEPDARRRAVRGGRRGVALRRGRHARAGGRAQRAACASEPRGEQTSLRRRGGRERRRGEAALRGARSARGGRRRDDEPLDLRAARRHPRGARRRGARAAQQPERDPGRRARGRAVREAGAGGAHHGAAGGPGRAARLRPDRRAATTNAQRRARRRRARSASAASPRPRATTPRAASRAGDAVGYAGGELVAWGDPAETLAATLARLADGAELLTCIAGERPPLGPRRRRGARPGRRRARVPRGRPARVVVAALRGVSACALRLEGARCRARRARSAPTRSRACSRSRSTGPKALEALGIATRGDLIEHLPHAHRDRRDVRLSASSRVGEEATVAVAVRGVTRQADARPPPQARRGAGVRRERPAGGGLVQPALDRPPARRGAHGAAARQAAPPQRVLGHASSSCSAADGAPVHTVGLVPVHPATEGISAAEAARADVGGLPAHARRRSSRCRRALRVAERLPDRPGRAGRRRTSPTARRTSRARAAGSRSRSCSCSSSPWPAGAARGARAAARGRSRRAAWWSTAGAGRCRSS